MVYMYILALLLEVVDTVFPILILIMFQMSPIPDTCSPDAYAAWDLLNPHVQQQW